MRILKNGLLFYLGGCVYMALELLYRGRTHWSMFLAGGTCLLLLGRLRNMRSGRAALTGALVITAVELAAGLLVNRDFRVWDYRDQPGNFLGQICPVFTALWIPVAWAAVLLYRFLDKKITGQLSRPVTYQFIA